MVNDLDAAEIGEAVHVDGGLWRVKVGPDEEAFIAEMTVCRPYDVFPHPSIHSQGTYLPWRTYPRCRLISHNPRAAPHRRTVSQMAQLLRPPDRRRDTSGAQLFLHDHLAPHSTWLGPRELLPRTEHCGTLGRSCNLPRQRRATLRVQSPTRQSSSSQFSGTTRSFAARQSSPTRQNQEDRKIHGLAARQPSRTSRDSSAIRNSTANRDSATGTQPSTPSLDSTRNPC